MREIGSEFSLPQNLIPNLQAGSVNDPLYSNAFFFSTGRAALYAILQKIKAQRQVKKACLPNYCCFSMVLPFIDSGIEVLYYDVEFKNGSVEYKIDYNADFDLFLSVSYFGFEVSNQDKIVEELKKQGKTVIEDITHRLLNGKKSYADYHFASLRKWFPLLSGGAAFAEGVQSGKIPLSDEYLKLRQSAMEKKEEYLLTGEQNADLKTEFLAEFSAANKILCANYKDCAIDNLSLKILNGIDKTKIAKQRHQNAKTLYKRLNGKVEFMFKLEKNDVPLFVPIVLKDKLERNALRATLTQNGIYCPVHWPNEIKSNNPIFDKELSIIIDQRYKEQDMHRIADILEERM